MDYGHKIRLTNIRTLKIALYTKVWHHRLGEMALCDMEFPLKN